MCITVDVVEAKNGGRVVVAQAMVKIIVGVDEQYDVERLRDLRKDIETRITDGLNYAIIIEAAK